MLWSFEPRSLFGEKFTNGIAVAFKKCYFIRLRGTKEGQECASVGHLEIFSMSSGKRQRKRNLKRARGVQEVLERQNRSTWEEK